MVFIFFNILLLLFIIINVANNYSERTNKRKIRQSTGQVFNVLTYFRPQSTDIQKRSQ